MDAYTIFKSLHGYLGMIGGVMLLVLVIMSFVYFFNKKTVNSFFKKLSLFTLITFHLQLIIGLIVLFMNQTIRTNVDSYMIQGKVPVLEHLFSNFTCILLVTIFYRWAKSSYQVSYKMLAVIGIALILLARTFLLYAGVLNH